MTALELLAAIRPEQTVALGGDGALSGRQFIELTHSLRRPEPGARRRVLIADPEPVGFLARLLAALADGDVPVVPPNFQPEALRELAGLPAPDEVPAGVFEMYTSGSTGGPKCVNKRLAQLTTECAVLERCWGAQADGAVLISSSPCHHIYGLLFRLLWPLLSGRPFDAATAADPSTLAARLARFERTVFISSPAQLSRLPELLDLAHLPHRPQLVFSSGGPLARSTADQFAAAWPDTPLVEIFGSTETGGIAWRRQVQGPRWTPFPGIAVGTGDDGALAVRSPFLYETETHEMDDAAEIAPDGSFALLGRLDRVVKIEEKRLALPELEAWILQFPGIEAAAAVPVTLGRRTHVGVVLVARGAPERRLLVAALKRHVAARFDAVLVPRRWRFVERMPYNERGKLAQRELAELLSAPA